jgi:hypothetical protein
VTALVALVALGGALILGRATAVRTRRLLASSAPEGGIVLGLSSAGINLAHLPLLEWDAISMVCVAEPARRARPRNRDGHRQVTVGLAVPDIAAARARIIDARLGHLVHPFPRRPGGENGGVPALASARTPAGTPAPTPARAGYLSIDLGDLLDSTTIDTVTVRLEAEAAARDIPFRRVSNRRRLREVLRPR